MIYKAVKKALVAFALLGASTSAYASLILDVDFNLAGWGGSSTTVIDYNFDAAALSSIDGITIELAHSWASDIELFLYAPDSRMFSFTNDNGGNSNLGDGGSDLSGLSTYEFRQFAPNGRDWDDSTAAGVYQADSWQSGPFNAGAWRLVLNDDAGADDGAVGNITINGTYVAVPEPSTLAIFALGIIGLASRRFKK